MQKQEIIKTDVLIVGAGVAGCVAALELAENKKIKILLVTKERDIEESATFYAQGGIIGRGENDTEEKLKKDILTAGAGLCDKQAVEILAKEGPDLVEEILIEKTKVEFSKGKNDKYDYTREAAHCENRILHSGDRTGKEIETKLVKKIKNKKNIKIFTDHTLADLLTLPHHAVDSKRIYDNKKCVGCYLLDNKNGQVKTVLAKRTVLATGGIGQIYLRTTNPDLATGDGLAAANRAGAEIINTEYIQFHPTSLFHRDGNNFLISEAVRGEGARIKDAQGKLFMKKYDPRGSLAPRDIVARGIYEEILNSKNNFVYLDLASYRKPNFIKKRFPKIYQICLSYGIDIAKEKIPVAPTAHYFCGGIRVDEFGRSSLENLRALGEVSCTGAHGANRLASASLLEGLTWAKRCADCVIRELKNNVPLVNEKEIKPWVYIGHKESDPALIKQDWLSIKSIMWNYVGIVRTKERLERAVADLNYLNHRIEKFYRNAALSRNLLELRNGIQTSLIIAEAAKRNKKSRGCHYISGY